MSTVEFPGLGLSFTVNRVAFEVLGLSIYWYGILIAAAFLVAVLLGMKDSRKYGLNPDMVIDLVLYAAPVAIVCARLYYVIFSWQDFRYNLADIFNTRQGGLAVYGGVLGAFAVGWIYAKRKKISPLELLDFGVVYIPLAQAIGRWGNFVNQEAFGTNTQLPWGMTSDTIKQELMSRADVLRAQGITVDPNLPVHPTFLYESLWNLGVFFFLLWYRDRKKLNGEVFFLYMILYGLGRFWIEGLRTDSLMLGNLRISQVLAGLFAAVLAVVFFIRRRKESEALLETSEVGTSRYGAVLRKLEEEEGESAAEPGPETSESEGKKGDSPAE